MATNQQNNEEEVDLGSLFAIIGKGFSNLFQVDRRDLFKGIFHSFIIAILLFLKATPCSQLELQQSLV